MGRGKECESKCETFPYVELLWFIWTCPNYAHQLANILKELMLMAYCWLFVSDSVGCSCCADGREYLTLIPFLGWSAGGGGETPTHPVQPSGCKYRTWCWYLSSCCYGLCFLWKKAVKMVIFRQSAELNKLRQDYARLVNELGEKSSKLQQEELQKKNAEQAVAQLKVTWDFCACRGFIWAKLWVGRNVRCVRIASAVSLVTKSLSSLYVQVSVFR